MMSMLSNLSPAQKQAGGIGAVVVASFAVIQAVKGKRAPVVVQAAPVAATPQPVASTDAIGSDQLNAFGQSVTDGLNGIANQLAQSPVPGPAQPTVSTADNIAATQAYLAAQPGSYNTVQSFLSGNAAARAAGRPYLINSPGKSVVPAGHNTYVIKAGDTLPSIAQAVYGDYTKWPTLFSLNQSILGTVSGTLVPGMTLETS